MATGVACSGGAAPELDGLADQVAEVGTELQINLNGTDTDGAALSYSYNSQVPDITGNAEITVSPSGTGVFHWTPLAADVGSWYFDFTVAAGGAKTTVTIQIEVKSAIGAATAPIFREPLGTGTTLDTATTQCLSIDVVIDDQDSAAVAITQQAPLIDGATLTPVDGLTSKWKWCPTAAQIAAQNRYTLALSADDGDNPPTVKDYLIVLLGGATCPGAGPTIAHTPANQTTILDLELSATITDPAGLKDTPLLYYSATQPAMPPDLGAMTQLSMAEASGNAMSGTWAAAVPNPVASMPTGTTATLYYVFAADDDGSASGSASCVRTTTSPVYQMTVTAGGTGAVAACGTCSADVQCGAGNECVTIGTMGASYCLPACSAGCGTGYTCSPTTVMSIDGATEKVCEPSTGTCVEPPATCVDTTFGDTETQSDASHNPALPPGTYDMNSCPNPNNSNADDDWYKFVLTSSQRVDFLLAGGSATDLDLHMYHSNGTVITASTSDVADEEVTACLPAATYYIKVNGFGHAANPYTLAFTSTAETCVTTCVDDDAEDDDTFSQARDATELPYESDDQAICPNDDDWYHVVLFTGDDLTVDLTFTQTSEANDLDLHLYQDNVDLTPCSPADDSGCSTANGQGTASNEHTDFVAPAGCDAGCDYDVVVRGWDGASNSYSIAIDVQ